MIGYPQKRASKGTITMAKEKLWTGPFISMGSTNFFQLMTQYILVTTLPLCIINTFQGSEIEAGLAMTFFQIGTSLFRPAAGYFVDKENKRHLLLFSLIVFLIVIGAFNGIENAAEIYGLRLLHGIIFALATTTAASIAVLVIPASRRGEGIGYFSVTTNLAMVIGPLAGLLLYNGLGMSGLFLSLTTLAILTLVIAAMVPLPKAVVKPVPQVHDEPIWSHIIEKKSLPASLLGGLVFFAYGGILTFIPLYAAALNLSDSTGLFFAIFALVIVLSRPVVGNVFDRMGASAIVYPGFIIFMAGFIVFSQVTSQVTLLIAAAILGLGFGALSPAFQTLAIQSVPPERAGAATATYFWFLDIFVGLAAMHNEAFKKLGLDYVYVCFEVDNSTLEDTVKGLRAMKVRGWNVSMPNKGPITRYVDKLTPVSQIVGACNTVVNDNGVLTGTSTDGVGAMMALKAHGVDYIDKKMTVIGAGGAASSIQVQAALDGVRELTIFNLKDKFYDQAIELVAKLKDQTDCTVNLYDLADHEQLRQELDSSDIYIDATPCGMHPLEDVVSIPDPSYLHPGLVVMDTVYAPRQTKLLKWAEQAGCQNFNGLDMMLYQGAAAFKLWTGKEMPVDFIRDVLFDD